MESRLAVYALVLRELVHCALGRVATEPWLHDKRALAAHAHDDAQLLTAILARLQTPAPSVAVLGDHDPYASVKPGLAVAVRDHLAQIDASAAPEDAQLLSDIATRQELHVAELPARHEAPPFVLGEDAGTPLAVEDAPIYPARDPFVDPGRAADGPHRRLNTAILAAEVAGRTAYEHPDRPWAFHADMARLAADRLSATAALDRELAASGRHWGDEPVDLAPFSVTLRQDVPGRLRFAADPNNRVHAEILLRWS
jgi:hypothetical protein